MLCLLYNLYFNVRALSLFSRQKRATYLDRVRILSDAALGLAAMHAALYLHRDIKVRIYSLASRHGHFSFLRRISPLICGSCNTIQAHNVMLCVNDSGELHAKLADLGSAVLLPSAAALRTDATGTSGYAGEPPHHCR